MQTSSNNHRPVLPTIAPLPFAQPPENEPDLRYWLTILRRRLWLSTGVGLATTAVIGVWALTRTPIYEGRFQLLVEPVSGENRLDKLAQVTQAPEQYSSGSGLDYDTQIQVLRSPQLMVPIIQQLQLKNPELTYESVMGNTTISRLQETKILEVRYRDPDPAQVKFVLDQLSQGYLKYSLQERQTSLRQGIQFVDNQLGTLQQRVDRLQGQLQEFRQRYNFIEPDLQAESLSKQSQDIADQKLEIQKQLAEAQATYEGLQGAGAAPVLRDAAQYQRLLAQLRDLETKIATESARFSDSNPAIVTLREQQQNLLPLLQQEARQVLGTKVAEIANQIEVLAVKRDAIVQSEARINRQLDQLPAISRQYTDLQRELKVASESLNRFLATRETLQVESAQKDIPWQLISVPKQPLTPSSPSLSRNILLGLMAGLLAGIGAALLAERLDNTFRSVEGLKARTKLPLLGIIPYNAGLAEGEMSQPAAHLARLQGYVAKASWFNGSNSYETSGPYAQFTFLEAFRSLFTNIRMLGSDHPIRSLVVSSALPGDGKSTVAVHLAIAAASMGQRVLLVDADLRRPQVNQILDLPNLRGLSTLIVNEVDGQQLIQAGAHSQKTGESHDNNLFVLTSGPNPPDPTKLLSSHKMQSWMERFQLSYDLVIYDTPPLTGLADASLIAPHTDGVVLVVGLERTDRNTVKHAIEGLKLSHTPILGMVANGSKHHFSSSYSYYHRYYQSNTN